MLTGLPAALAMLVQAPAATQPSAPPPPKPSETVPAADRCPAPSTTGDTIVVCTVRPQGYRIDPDVLEAKREMKRDHGRPVRPGGKPIPDCAHVGPAPCMTAGINLLAAALTAAEMAKRAASGDEIGSMFVTDPHPSEYQLYQMAKARREAEEADKAAKKAKAAAEARQAQQPAGN
jgi:hypothetical protein